MMDRLAALRAFQPSQLAALLARVPALAEAVEGRGPLSPGGVLRRGGSPPLHDLRRVAALLASPPAIDVTLAALTEFELQLAMLAAWHGGSLTREQATAEAGAHRGADLDRARDVLVGLLLADDATGWLTLRPGVLELVDLPGIPLRPSLEYRPSENLAGILRMLGNEHPPPRKRERIDAVEAWLRDREVVTRLLDRMGDDERRVFALLCKHGEQRVADLGIPYFNAWGTQRTPLHWLAGNCLVGVDTEHQVAWVWLDIIVALNGALFTDWRPSPGTPRAAPLRDPGAGLPPVVGRLTALLDTWAADPAPALADGGLGVRPVRAAAKELGAPSGEMGLLASVAIGLGLLGTARTKVTGRGRNRREEHVWTPTDRAAQWRAEEPARRWARLVQGWREDRQLDEGLGLPERCDTSAFVNHVTGYLARQALLVVLVGLPHGHGLAEEEFLDQAAFSRPRLLGGERGKNMLSAARALGLVPPDGPVGLTDLARALLMGIDVLTDAMPAPRSDFVVQGDHTVIAPPDLAPEIAARLERYCDLESAAGARVYRLSEQRIALALGTGDTGEDVIAFLAEHSAVALPQPVEYLVTDCARRHGRLRAGSCSSYLRCDDPALLARAAGYKTAKLRLLAPTVAVSTLPRSKLVTALRQRGLTPVAESADGATLVESLPAGAPALAAASELPRLEEAVLPTAADLEARAKALLDAPDGDQDRQLFPGEWR